ncbi:cellobiose phosphorylase [Sulfuriferula plumbiphila]|uniref:Cellobiose phosphorylase n=1 Tax=Sulfuriferula plumbiphila TaxID=171865 RepID=A0A512L9L1_9PROT|nr:TolC family protein [Sulfuriferula plumbiphila]BBP05989.1 cellobiose phosphorylase [Sulfuriferula plumbiphila]GEP31142.1 cellobiose phosphorylase [Sulfuriferula plumbiphila]
MQFKISALVLLLGALSGCATYAPKPLPKRANLPQSAALITLDPARLPFRNLSSHIFNPADGLDMDEVAMLAVANNPQLRQARDALGIARAQSFAAGLLPDPQLGFTSDHPTNGALGNTNSFNFNLNYDVNALLLRSSRKGAAQAQAQRVNLDLLWQEWQVVSQARLLFTRLTAQQALMAQLQTARSLLADRYQRSQQALAAGNITLDLASADLVALQNIERRINELERSRLQNRASLNGLLGLLSTTPLALVGQPRAALMDAAAVQSGLVERLNQRPDLQALQAGYRSQEEKFRGAVLAQFPALTVGLTRARDTSGLYTMGFGLTMSLPIFNRNRGNIAIENATRTKLFDAYQGRLNSAYSEVATALENQPLLQTQLQRTRQGVKQLQTVARRAEAAFHAGNLAAADYVRLQIALLDKQTEVINLQEALMEQQIALETLLGPDLPEQASNRRAR